MPLPEIKSVGIAGAGTMGTGIAQVCALAGYETFLFDIDSKQAQNGITQIGESIQRGVDKGKYTADQKRIALSRLNKVESLSDLKADLIIEAAVEDLKIKQDLFLQLETVNTHSIFATNTSSISVTQIAKVLKDPSRCIGLHFFNPAPIMKLVEVISGATTSPEIAAKLKEFCLSLQKVAVEAKDSPGFIVNRVARHYYVESLQLLEEGVADVSTIDELLQSSGFRMGPFKLMDLIGVDTNFAVTTTMYNAFHQDAKFRPSRIQEQKVNAGLLGRKTGMGFYDYSNE